MSEQELKDAIKQSVNPAISPDERRQYFDLVRELHSQRDEETIRKMEARFK